MGSVIFLALVVWGVILLVKKFSSSPSSKGSNNPSSQLPPLPEKGSKPQMQAEKSSSTPDYMKSPAQGICDQVVEVFEHDPERALSLSREALQVDPSCFLAHLSIAAASVRLLENLADSAIDSDGDLCWRDEQLADRCRNLATDGLLHGEKANSLSRGEFDNQAGMVNLHTWAAAVARVDKDYNAAFDHNCKTLQWMNGHEELSDQAIEVMLADTRHANPSRLAEMLNVFSNLADENAAWVPLTVRFQKIIRTTLLNRG